MAAGGSRGEPARAIEAERGPERGEHERLGARDTGSQRLGDGLAGLLGPDPRETGSDGSFDHGALLGRLGGEPGLESPP